MSFIEIRDLEKNIKGKNILNNINLNFEKGKIYGIKGHNGCGKTMLLRAICGLITPDSGSVAIDGKYIKKDIDFPESMGVLIENPEFWKNMTGHQVLKTLAGIKNEIVDNENTELTNSITSNKQTISQLEAQLQDQSSKCIELETEVNEFENRLNQERSRIIAESNQVLNQKEDENQHLTIALTNINRELEALRSENDELNAHLKQYDISDSSFKEREKQNQSIIESLQADIEKHKRNENELKSLVEQGNKNYEEMKEEGEKKEKALQELQLVITDKESMLNELNEKEKEQDQLIQQLQEECNKKKEEFEKVEIGSVMIIIDD